MTTNESPKPMPVSELLELDSTKAVILALHAALDSEHSTAMIEAAMRHEGLDPASIDPEDDTEAGLAIIDHVLDIEHRVLSVVLVEAMERAGIDYLDTDDHF